MYKYKKIQFRPIEKADLPFLREMHNDYSTLRYLTDVHMVNVIEQEDWYNNICKSRTSMRFLIINNEDKIGCMRFDHYDAINSSIQIGGDIHKDYRGRGFGKMMFNACMYYAFNILNCHRVYLNVLETNKIALNMYVNCGMKQEGVLTESVYRDGKYFNCINFYMTIDMYRSKCKE